MNNLISSNIVKDIESGNKKKLSEQCESSNVKWTTILVKLSGQHKSSVKMKVR